MHYCTRCVPTPASTDGAPTAHRKCQTASLISYIHSVTYAISNLRSLWASCWACLPYRCQLYIDAGQKANTIIRLHAYGGVDTDGALAHNEDNLRERSETGVQRHVPIAYRRKSYGGPEFPGSSQS